MENYKKKPLKFSGFGREVRAKDINLSRQIGRHQRFSLLRCLNEDSDHEEPAQEKTPSKIPIFGKAAELPRAAMLQKYKEEKAMRKARELQLKKPVFRAGSKPSRILTSLENIKKNNANISKISFRAKPELTNTRNAGTSKESDRQPINKSYPVHVKPSSKVSIAFSAVRKPSSATANIKSELHKPQISGISHVKNEKVSKPTGAIPKKVVNKIPSSSLPKPTSRLPTTKSVQASSLNVGSSGLPSLKPTRMVSEQNLGKRGLPLASNINIKTATSLPQLRPKGIPAKTDFKGKTFNMKIPVAKPSEAIGSPINEKNVTFRCEISTIEPLEEKSFAPIDFVFRPPSEIQELWLLNDSISSFVKQQEEKRTSTPKKPVPEHWNTSGEASRSKTNSGNKSAGRKYIGAISPLAFELEDLKVEPESKSLPKEKSQALFPTLPKQSEDITTLLMEEILSESAGKSTIAGTDEKQVQVQNVQKDDPEEAIQPVMDKLSKVEPIHGESFKKQSEELCTENDMPSITSSNELQDKLSDSVATDTMLRATADSVGQVNSQLPSHCEQPLLESIREETTIATPVSRRKKTFLDNPRRSLRLARLSEPCIFDEPRPSLMVSPTEVSENPAPSSSNDLPFDFDRLHLEPADNHSQTSQPIRISTRVQPPRKGKVSLLYTPPIKDKSRKSTIKGDLMYFSPDV